MQKINAEMLQDVRKYYRDSLLEHGPGARGMDWRDIESVWKRFEILADAVEFAKSLVPDTRKVVIGDLGCGSGMLVDWLGAHGIDRILYRGIDVEPLMIEHARRLHDAQDWAEFQAGTSFVSPVDVVLCSGVMNVRQDKSRDQWRDKWVTPILEEMVINSRICFGINFLRNDGDTSLQRPDLFYTSVNEIRQVLTSLGVNRTRVSEHYGLHEFSIFGYRTDWVPS